MSPMFPVRSVGIVLVNWHRADSQTALMTMSSTMTEDSRIEIRSVVADRCCSSIRMDSRRWLMTTKSRMSVVAVVEVGDRWSEWPFDLDLTFDYLTTNVNPTDDRSGDCPCCVDRAPSRKDCPTARDRTRHHWNMKRSMVTVVNSKVMRMNRWEMQNVLPDWLDDECRSRDWPVTMAMDWNHGWDDDSLVLDREVRLRQYHCRMLPKSRDDAREKITVHSNDDQARWNSVSTRPVVDCEIN